MSYLTTKYIKGNPYLYQVRSERRGDRVVQVFERYLGRAETVDRTIVAVRKKVKRPKKVSVATPTPTPPVTEGGITPTPEILELEKKVQEFYGTDIEFIRYKEEVAGTPWGHSGTRADGTRFIAYSLKSPQLISDVIAHEVSHLIGGEAEIEAEVGIGHGKEWYQRYTEISKELGTTPETFEAIQKRKETRLIKATKEEAGEIRRRIEQEELVTPPVTPEVTPESIVHKGTEQETDWEINKGQLRKLATEIGIPKDKVLPPVIVTDKVKTAVLHETPDTESGYIIGIPQTHAKSSKELGQLAEGDIKHELEHYYEHIIEGTKPGKQATPYEQAKGEIQVELRAKTANLPLSLANIINGIKNDYSISTTEAKTTFINASKELALSQNKINQAIELYDKTVEFTTKLEDLLQSKGNYTEAGNLKPNIREQLIKDVSNAIDNDILSIEQGDSILKDYPELAKPEAIAPTPEVTPKPVVTPEITAPSEPKIVWVDSWRDIVKAVSKEGEEFEELPKEELAKYEELYGGASPSEGLDAAYIRDTDTIYAVRGKATEFDVAHEKYHALRFREGSLPTSEQDTEGFVEEELKADKYAYEKMGYIDDDFQYSIGGIVYDLTQGNYRLNLVEAFDTVRRKLDEINAPPEMFDAYKEMKARTIKSFGTEIYDRLREVKIPKGAWDRADAKGISYIDFVRGLVLKKYPELAKPEVPVTPEVTPEVAPLTVALIKDGQDLVASIEKTKPKFVLGDLLAFKQALAKAESSTGEARLQALRDMETLEPKVREVAKVQGVPAIPKAKVTPTPEITPPVTSTEKQFVKDFTPEQKEVYQKEFERLRETGVDRNSAIRFAREVSPREQKAIERQGVVLDRLASEVAAGKRKPISVKQIGQFGWKARTGTVYTKGGTRVTDSITGLLGRFGEPTKGLGGELRERQSDDWIYFEIGDKKYRTPLPKAEPQPPVTPTEEGVVEELLDLDEPIEQGSAPSSDKPIDLTKEWYMPEEDEG